MWEVEYIETLKPASLKDEGENQHPELSSDPLQDIYIPQEAASLILASMHDRGLALSPLLPKHFLGSPVSVQCLLEALCGALCCMEHSPSCSTIHPFYAACCLDKNMLCSDKLIFPQLRRLLALWLEASTA